MKSEEEFLEEILYLAPENSVMLGDYTLNCLILITQRWFQRPLIVSVKLKLSQRDKVTSYGAIILSLICSSLIQNFFFPRIQFPWLLNHSSCFDSA